MLPSALLFWLCIAVMSQLTLAFYSLFSRYLTTISSPNIPALRLVFLANMLAEISLILFFSAPTRLRQVLQHCIGKMNYTTMGLAGWSQKKSNSRQGASFTQNSVFGEAQGIKAHASSGCLVGVDASCRSSCSSGGLAVPSAAAAGVQHGVHSPPPAEHRQSGAASTRHLYGDCGVATPAAPLSGTGTAQQVLADGVDTHDARLPNLHHRSPQVAGSPSSPGRPLSLASKEVDTGEHLPDGTVNSAVAHDTEVGAQDDGHQRQHCRGHIRLAAELQDVGVRPEVPMRRGLSRRFDALVVRGPTLYRYLTIATLTLSFLGIYGFLALAPVFVDPSIPQLLMQFSVLGTALVQSVLLRVRPPFYTWPCAFFMVGGAAMVIVPTIGQGSSGSLSSGRAWVGMAFSILALAASIVYLVVIQATQHLGLKSEQLNHTFFLSGALLFGTLSLPIDGTHWAGQLEPWTAGDWLLLTAMSTVCYLGSATAIQHCVWQLGAATTAMFFGLRLVFTVALSKPILGSTVIITGIQVAGVAVTAAAVTTYVGLQGWHARRKRRMQMRLEQPDSIRCS